MSKRVKDFGYMPTMLMAIPPYLLAFLGIFLAFPADANLRPTSGATYLSPRFIQIFQFIQIERTGFIVNIISQ
ncbi:unnamed protein product [Gongylonema pulchrum]|uniref:Sugar ABC transporter permease n=1 Tax=Gongylonema pulchrum TaxID=637853 RepID=A0A183EQN7_9BILA|nr:unnamed protein product [Gongylonema pulchrum]VDN41281.1 unnamed protein product [Gongylonema pulchrum]